MIINDTGRFIFKPIIATSGASNMFTLSASTRVLGLTTRGSTSIHFYHLQGSSNRQSFPVPFPFRVVIGVKLEISQNKHTYLARSATFHFFE